MSEKIKVTMVETVRYEFNYSLEALADLLGEPEITQLPPDAARQRLLAIVADPYEEDVDLDGELLDSILNHYDGCTDREWSAE